MLVIIWVDGFEHCHCQDATVTAHSAQTNLDKQMFETRNLNKHLQIPSLSTHQRLSTPNFQTWNWIARASHFHSSNFQASNFRVSNFQASNFQASNFRVSIFQASNFQVPCYFTFNMQTTNHIQVRCHGVWKNKKHPQRQRFGLWPTLCAAGANTYLA